MFWKRVIKIHIWRRTNVFDFAHYAGFTLKLFALFIHLSVQNTVNIAIFVIHIYMPFSRVVWCLDVIIIRIRVRFGYHIPLIRMMVSEIFQYDKLISSRHNASSEYMVNQKYINMLLSHLAYSNLKRILIYNILLP